MFKNFFLIFSLIFLLSIASCAKRGFIDGGQKDTLGPILKMSFPKNEAIEFVGNEIKLIFDEYVKIKDINKQLIVSPPMKKNPEVLPTTASKFLTIKLKDSLLPNTTYSFNFGQSIEDFNEGNPYKQFKFVFSTGKYIDSLKLNGTIKDAFNKKSDNFVSVMLYEINEKYNDSVIYKQNPRYITNTLDSLKSFRVENIKSGKYKLIALKDINNNNKFDPREDKIGFLSRPILIPNDSVFELKLFKEQLKTKVLKPRQESGNRLVLPFEGNLKNPKIEVKSGNNLIKTIVTKFRDKDSLQVWFNPVKTDSLKMQVDKELFNIKIKELKRDTLYFEPKQKNELGFKEDFIIKSSLPLIKINKNKISVRNKDTLAVDFTTEYDEFNQDLKIKFKNEPLEKYKIMFLPGATTTFFDNVNQISKFQISTKNITDYGNLRLILQNIKQFPIIIELTDDNGKTIYREYSEKEININFDLIEPSKYSLRLIYDSNKNRLFDTGSYLEKLQPEEVIYFSKLIDVRANWDVEQIWDLK